jgi:DNA-binding NarL/FixJ family response regulator
MRPTAAEASEGDVRVSELKIGADQPLTVISFALQDASMGEPLTRAEISVASAACEGRSNGEIARRRGTSARTVANQLASIFRKLHVNSRSELAICCRRASPQRTVTKP